jgi:hypothetical protein
MNCLNDAQIQALVDNEADAAIRQHAEVCAGCNDRVRARRALTSGVVDALNPPAALPLPVSRRVERALADGPARGATRLRENARPVWRRAVWSGGAVAAATLIGIFFVFPMMKGPTTVSASEILAKSASKLAQRVTAGVEFLEYDLTLDGIPGEMMPDNVDGSYRVRQVIDHDTPGRFVISTHGPDGQLVHSIAQDPAARRRIIHVRVDGRPFRFDFSVADAAALALPEMERLHMEASVAMMQASGTKDLKVLETGSGRQYQIDVPRVSGATPNAMWDLSEARVIVDATDYHIVEFEVKGAFLKRPYSVSYKLISRGIAQRLEVPASVFEIPDDAQAITIEGEGSAIPVRDALLLALRELGRAKQAGR